MLPEWTRGGCCIQKWGVRCLEGMQKLSHARHLWVLSPIGACWGQVAGTENLSLLACQHLGHPSTGASVGRCSCTWGKCLNSLLTSWSLCISTQVQALLWNTETPHIGVFAPVLILWLCCSIFSHHCSKNITKKLVLLRLGLVLFKPWVFASRIVSWFMEKEDYNQNCSSTWSNSLRSVGKKAVPPLPPTSGTPISIAVAKESCEHVISSCCCIHLSSGLSSAIP